MFVWYIIIGIGVVCFIGCMVLSLYYDLSKRTLLRKNEWTRRKKFQMRHFTPIAIVMFLLGALFLLSGIWFGYWTMWHW